MSDVASPSILASLGIDLKVFVAQLVNFGIVMLVLWKWGYAPLMGVISAREKKINDGLASAREGKRLLEEAEEKQNRLMKEARREANELLGQARAEAEEERRKALEETNADLERQLADARARLVREKAQTLALARRELATMVIDTTRRVAEGLSAADQRALIDRSLAEVTAQDTL